MTRPGGEKCRRCKVVTEYREMTRVRATGYKLLVWVCRPCADRWQAMGLVS